MNATDDPTIPDDLGALLRSGSRDLEVSPAPLRSVARRAGQRRRRRHGLVAGGAAALLLLAGLAVALATGGDGGEQVVTATEPPVVAGSAPQPILAAVAGGNGLMLLDGSGTEGGSLIEQTRTGSQTWWKTTGAWLPTSGVVLADGRRFGIAQTMSFAADAPPSEVRIHEIGPDGTSTRSLPLPSGDPGSSTSVTIVGATGNELILQRDVNPPADLPSNTPFETSSTLSAVNVDTGTERPLLETDGGRAAAAADVVVRAEGTDCTLIASALDGSDERTVEGGCAPGIDGLEGMAYQLALSPDGRYVAVIWTSIRTTGLPEELLQIIDLETGEVVQSHDQRASSANALAWTGDRVITVAIGGDDPGVNVDLGGVTLQSVGWNINGG